MMNNDAEKTRLVEEFREREPGVAEALELYLKIEKVYFGALIAPEEGFLWVSDSTNGGGQRAYVGTNPQRTE